MAPHSEMPTSAAPASTDNGEKATQSASNESSLEAATKGKVPRPPTFQDKYDERQYQKERLALAFRIFAKLGFDEGVAGHITLRVSIPCFPRSLFVVPFKL
jgi:hypothetical protein